MTSRPSARNLALLTAAGLLTASASAQAGGFASARFGGERGNPTEANPFALYYNPGGLGMTEGTRLTLDGNFVFRDASYERPLAAGVDANSAEGQANFGEGTLSNFLIAPALAVSSDLGGSPVTLGLGFFVPFGGSAVWDTADPVEGAAGAVDGVQRWYTIDGTIQSLAFSLGGAYLIEPANLSIGLATNLYLSKVETIRARNSDGSDTIDPIEGRSFISVESTDLGLGLGLRWEPIKDSLWVGLSYQSQPGFGTMTLKGNLKNLLATAEPSDTPVELTQSLPDIVRLGARYRISPELEARLFADFTRWSTFENQCILNEGDGPDAETICATEANGAYTNADRPNNAVQVLKREWEDTFGARLGLSYWPMEALEIQVGGGFDSSAIPDQFLEPALFDMNKTFATLGLRYDFTDSLGMTVAATNVFYEERDTTGVATSEGLENPSTQPSSAGIYNQSIFLLNANLDMAF